MYLSLQNLSEWASAILVFVCGAVAGHHASIGMSPAQWAGAAAAVLGSVTVAVLVRIWPAPERVVADQEE